MKKVVKIIETLEMNWAFDRNGFVWIVLGDLRNRFAMKKRWFAM